MLINKFILKVVCLFSLLLFIIFFSRASWILTKAYLATYLIDDAWQLTLENKGVNKPWSWADTWPVAEISIDNIGLNEIVLFGDSGEALAFGPGLSNASTGLDEKGVKLISAHRDTHFSELKNISVDDEVIIRSAQRQSRYKVSHTEIVDSRYYTIDASEEDKVLVLVTCYPFDALTAGGFQRFVVYADEIKI